MTNRLPGSFKINSMASDYSEFEETSTEVQNQGQRAPQRFNPLTWLNRDLYETRVEVPGCAFTLKQLIDATRKFSPQMELRRGRSGVLYKAELPNLTVAVAKTSQHYSKDIGEIRSDISLLKYLEHDNIVKLFVRFSIKNLDLAIYEYMENGSLAQVLFGLSSVELSWDLRFNICLGVARGLRHLDDKISYFVAPGSIQPSNIMLDANLNAKLMDFDPKWFHYDDDPFLILKTSSVMYMAPEYCLNGAITQKAAVYSYGIVLFEIISGRRFAEIRENQILNEILVSHDRRRPLELMDKRLVSYDYNQVLLVMNLAMMCIDAAPSRRPTMFEVLEVLEGKRTIEEVKVSKDPLGMI